MSVIVPISSLTPAILKKLDKDLHVKPIIQPLKSPVKISSKLVEAFDTFKLEEKDVAAIPFNYYYHHLENIERIPNEEFKPVSLKFEGNLLPRQKEVKDECVEILNRTGSVVLSLHTGFGKTVMAIYLASKIKVQTIIICHRKIIMDQWVQSINKYIPTATVRVLGEKMKRGYKGPEEQDVDFLICNVINIPKKDRMYFKNFGLVIIDEIHTICTDSFSRGLLYLFPDYMIGLSATPFRTDGMDRLIELFCGPEIIYRKLYKPFNAYKLKTGFKPKTELNVSGTLDWNSVLEDQAVNNDRNNLIANLCRYFINRNILVLVKRKEHADILKNILSKYGEDVDIFTGDSKECNYNCRILVATYSIAGCGFDMAKLDLLIGAADVLENFTQYIGRIFRRDDVSSIYIDLIDEMSTMKKHSVERLKICKELGAEVKDFEKTFRDFFKMISYLNL
jgi:superfamily II DNA or RNA helicase